MKESLTIKKKKMKEKKKAEKQREQYDRRQKVKQEENLKVKESCQTLKGKLSKEQERKHLDFLNEKDFQEK